MSFRTFVAAKGASTKRVRVIFFLIMRNIWNHGINICGVEGKRRLCDLNVTSSSPALTTRHIHCVLLVNSPNKVNLLSWRLIYLCSK